MHFFFRSRLLEEEEEEEDMEYTTILYFSRGDRYAAYKVLQRCT